MKIFRNRLTVDEVIANSSTPRFLNTSMNCSRLMETEGNCVGSEFQTTLRLSAFSYITQSNKLMDCDALPAGMQTGMKSPEKMSLFYGFSIYLVNTLCSLLSVFNSHRANELIYMRFCTLSME